MSGSEEALYHLYFLEAGKQLFACCTSSNCRLVCLYLTQVKLISGCCCADRFYWDAWDPAYVSEALFAVGNILNFTRLFYLMAISEHLGPMLVSLERMLKVVTSPPQTLSLLALRLRRLNDVVMKTNTRVTTRVAVVDTILYNRVLRLLCDIAGCDEVFCCLYSYLHHVYDRALQHVLVLRSVGAWTGRTDRSQHHHESRARLWHVSASLLTCRNF